MDAPPHENYSEVLGCSVKEQNHSIYSVSCLINKGLRIVSCQCHVRSKDRLTYDGNTITLSEDSDSVASEIWKSDKDL